MKKHQKKLKKIFFAVIMLGAMAAACIEDKGNYEYRDINDVAISGIDSFYTIAVGSRLTITPVLEFSVSETQDEFEFGWFVLNRLNFYMASQTLSTERNLNIVVTNPASSIPYWFLYCVTNINTGVRYEFRFQVSVLDEMQNGFILLHETENNFDIDLISTFEGRLTQYHRMLDIFESAFPRDDGRIPLDLVCYRDGISPVIGYSGKRYAVWILTDKGTDRVSVDNFQWEPTFNISGISSIPDRILQGEPLIAEKMHAPMFPTVTGGANWIYFKGDWYWYNLPEMAYFYMQPINAPTPESQPYKAAPFIFANTGRGAVLFNEDDNRFEYQAVAPMQGSGYNLRTQRMGSSTQMFNWENPDYSLIYMNNRTVSTGFAIVKNRVTNRYELLLMESGGMGQPPIKLGHGTFPIQSPNLEEIKFFAFHSSLPYLYVASDEQIFRINTNALQRWEEITSPQLVPSGHKISKMRSTALGFARTNQIAICTYDPNGQIGQNGRLAFFTVVDGTGDLILSKYPEGAVEDGEYQIDMEWTGFGRIINVHYKVVP